MRDTYDSFLVGAADDESSNAVLKKLLESDDLPCVLVRPGGNHTERFVEENLLTWYKVGYDDSRHDRDPHLATVGHDVHGAVFAQADESAITVGRISEAVDLALERDDLLACIAQGCDEARVVILLGRQFPPHLGEGRLKLP